MRAADWDTALDSAHEARKQAALSVQVRVNGDAFMTRRAIIDERVGKGARVEIRNGARILMSPDGAWFDERAITRYGMDYASDITPHLCSVCRQSHGLEVIHACE